MPLGPIENSQNLQGIRALLSHSRQINAHKTRGLIHKIIGLYVVQNGLNNNETYAEIDFDALQVGHSQIDLEHADLLSALQRLIASSPTDIGVGSFDDVLSELGKIIFDHFRHEEAVFKKLGMPDQDVQAHLQAHINIIEQYSMLCVNLLDDVGPTREDAISMVRQWVLKHFIDHDLKLRPYLMNKHLRPCWVN